MMIEVAAVGVTILQPPEIIGDLTAIFVPAAEQPHPRDYARRKVEAAPAAVEPQAEELSRGARFAHFADCMEIAFGGIVLVGALLFGAGLLRLTWVDDQAVKAALRDIAFGFDALAGLLCCAILFSFARGFYHLFARRSKIG